MKIGIIQASSQISKNETLVRLTKQATAYLGHEVINFGVFEAEETYSYPEVATMISLLLGSGALDFVVTGCSSGQGMALACNSLPKVLCGFVQNPQDAFLFGRINGGNAVSLPLGLGYGWLGELNLQYTLEKLFDGPFGVGYPLESAERKRFESQRVKELNHLAKRELCDLLADLDPDFLQKVLGKKDLINFILENGSDETLISFLKKARVNL